MRADHPVEVSVEYGPVDLTVPLANEDDGLAFIALQARMADTLGVTRFRAQVRGTAGLVVDVDVTGANIAGAARSAIDHQISNHGYTQMAVAGVDAFIYAHRSPDNSSDLVLGVVADDGQRILFAVDDGPPTVAVVGYPTSHGRNHNHHSPPACAPHSASPAPTRLETS